MRKKSIVFSDKAQTAVEYLLLMGVVMAVVLVGFQSYIRQTRNASFDFFKTAARDIMGKQNPCGDGNCHILYENKKKCPVDCD